MKLLKKKTYIKIKEYEICPLCGSKIEPIIQEEKDEEPSEPLGYNPDDWLLP